MTLQKKPIQELITQAKILIQRNSPNQARDLLDTCLAYLAYQTSHIENPLESRWLDKTKTKVWNLLEDNNLLLD
jgi:hypothetical protein